MAITWWLVAGGLLLVFLLGNHPLLSGREALIWDAEDLFAPEYTLVADHARAGRFVLWDPWIAAGAPDYAEPELGTTSPIQFGLGAITGGTESGFRLYFLLIWLLGPLGLVLLGRHFRAAPWLVFVVATGFAFCGFYTGHAQHVSSIYTFSLFPWVLWRFDVGLVSRRWWPAAQSGSLWGLSALGGYPELVILTAGFLFIWALARCSVRFPGAIADHPTEIASDPPSLRHGLASLAIVAVVGTVVLLPPYVAFFAEGHGYSDRVGPRSRQEAVTSNATPASAFLTFSSTYLTTLRMPEYRNLALWPKSDVSLTNIYLGSLIPILAVFAIICRPRSPAHWFLVGVTAFCFVCAVGGQLPLRGWLYDFLLPTRYFRNPSLFRQYGMFSIALLALWASDDLRLAVRQPLSRAWKYLAVTAGVLTAAAVLAYFYIVSLVNNRGALFPQATRDSALIWISAFVVVSVCWIVPRTRKLFPAMLVLLAIGHAFFTIRLARPTMSSSRSTREVWTKIDAAHTRRLDVRLQRQVVPPIWIGAFANNENVPLKIPTFFNYETMTNRFQEDFLGHPVLLAMSTGDNRIWFSQVAATASPTDPPYDAFVQRSNQLGVPVIVVHPRAEMADLRFHNQHTRNDAAELNAIEHLPPAQRIPARLLRYTPNHLDLQVNCPTPGWLLVTDRWANGWQVTVNGTPAELFGADFIFRVVRTNAGSNVVKFSYRPAGWPWLLAISWGLLAAVLVSTAAQLVRQLAQPPAIDGIRSTSSPSRKR